MRFKQYKNGSCDIEFSWKERLILLRYGKLHLSDVALKDLSNVLLKIIIEWNTNFNDKTANKTTTNFTKIEGK